MHRVVITGAGAVTPLGADVAQTLDGLREGRGAIGPLDIPDVDRLSVRIGAQVQGFDPAAHFSRKTLGFLDRYAQFALLAAEEAVAASGIDTWPDPARAGVVMGTAAGGLHTQDDSYRAVYAEGKNRVHPFVVPRLMHNAAASRISMRFGLQGPVYTVSTACASSNHAIGQAFHLIRSGAADVMLAGGSEAMLVFGGIKAWEGLRVLSADGCYPFSAERSGMVMGEGGAVFVLESYARARARGADILAEVAGFAMTSDAGDMVAPDADGAARAMRGALADAAADAGTVGYINAHGTGTRANDRTETAAILEVFGATGRQVPVSATKSMHGHLIGGAGAVELLACILALREGVLAPTINYRTPDPECGLDVVANVARESRVELALSNAFAFGGLNAVLALRRV